MGFVVCFERARARNRSRSGDDRDSVKYRRGITTQSGDGYEVACRNTPSVHRGVECGICSQGVCSRSKSRAVPAIEGVVSRKAAKEDAKTPSKSFFASLRKLCAFA